MQCRTIPHVTTGKGPASLFLKRHKRTKIVLIFPSATDFLHVKQNVKNSNAKVKGFKINQKLAVRNYTSDAKWKIGRIIAIQGKLRYRIQVG